MSPEEIQGIFFLECEEALGAAEAGLAACAAGAQDDDTINGVFRAVHSIKGGAGAFGFIPLQSYTHAFETLLSELREGKLEVSPALIDLLLRALDILSDHVAAAREATDPPEDASLIAAMDAARQGGACFAPEELSVPAPAEDAAEVAHAEADPFDLDSMLDAIGLDMTGPEPVEHRTIRFRPHAGSMENGGEPLLLLRELAELGVLCTHCDVSAVPALDHMDAAVGYLGFTCSVPMGIEDSAIGEVFDFVGDDCTLVFGADAAMPSVRHRTPPALAASPAKVTSTATPPESPAPVTPQAVSAAPTPQGQTIRIDLAKLDRLIDSVGELVIAQAMLVQRLENAGVAATEELGLLEGLTREIQESAMSIRAQPIASVFSRVPRILRELAASTGKHVRLEVSGETTELDKTVIERLGEPLTHLIRNAVDHGIEPADARLAAGKPAEGTLTLSAEQRSGRIHICISDDGKGIDRDRVLAKAIDQGLVTQDAQLAPEEIDNLIFAPGFSTAQTISSVSGRGVGMDVVRQNVKDLGGRITIESQAGKGTTFTLSLPLTLAISDGMIVTVGDQTLVVPLANVIESLRPGIDEVQGMGAGRQMLNVRGRFIPVVPVCKAISATDCRSDAAQGVLIIVDTQAAGRAALLVDAICDQRQFVIKSLDANYRAVPGVAGATILGDGQVALILDVDGLVSSLAVSLEVLAA